MSTLRTRLVSVATLAVALGALPYGAAQAGSDGGDGGDPSREPSLPRTAHGQDAIDLLGHSLDEAAALNGWTTAELREVLQTDPTAWVDGSGRVLYREPVAPTSVPAPEADAAPYPLDQTFLLHSRPGSTKTLFVDFDGHNVSGTAWNQPPPTGSSLAGGDYPAWTLDGDAATFNTAEREAIQSIWQRVSEDYAPFDIDVTTQDPGAAGIDKADAGDQVYGIRALVSPSNTAKAAICPSGCGGVAYVNVFNDLGGYYQPAWVFPQSLGPNNTKMIAEAVSHEAGHNFGLRHDGRTSPAESYYQGHAMWAPIMGNGYYRPVTQWSKGEYTNANNTTSLPPNPPTNYGQDDVALIAANIPYVADETGSTPETASASLAGTKFITTAADQDVYALGGCQGTLAATALPAPNSPDLDIQLDLLNGSGAVVATSNPAVTPLNQDVASGLSASLNGSLRPGFYYLRVDGVGIGTGVTGYSDYGSIGSYTLSATGLTCGLNVPGAPGKGKAKSGKRGGKKTARFTWIRPSTTGGADLTSYTVQVLKKGKVVKTVTVAARKTSYTFKTRKRGKYAVVVIASNGLGASAPSTPSKAVKAT